MRVIGLMSFNVSDDPNAYLNGRCAVKSSVLHHSAMILAKNVFLPAVSDAPLEGSGNESYLCLVRRIQEHPE